MLSAVIFVLLLFAGNSDEKRLKIKVIAVRACNPEKSKMDLDVVIQNPLPTIRKIDRDTTVLDCNLTTTAFGPISFTFRSYQLTPNQRRLMLKLEKMTCSNPMTFKIVKVFQVNINKDCMIAAGNYHFENLNLNTFGWLLTKSATQPGKYSFLVDFASPKGIVHCTEIICELYFPKS